MSRPRLLRSLYFVRLILLGPYQIYKLKLLELVKHESNILFKARAKYFSYLKTSKPFLI